MSCHQSGAPFFVDPGTCTIKVVRGQNAQRVQVRLVTACQVDDAGPYNSAALEAGQTFSLTQGCAYSLFLSISRKSVAAGNACAQVDISANGNELFSANCCTDGQPLSGDWVVNCI